MRRRISCAAAAVCMALTAALTSCSSSETEEAAKLPESFSIHAEITDAKISAEADMRRSADGWLMTVTAPETVKGMQFLLSDGGWTISCDELSYCAGEEQLPGTSPLKLTARALDQCTKDKPAGKLDGQEYQVSFKDGKPRMLTAGSGLTVKFSKYKKTAHS